MDRRRFKPGTESLEGRSLLSGLFGGLGSAGTNPATYLPNTVATKESRINNTPYFLEQIQPGRVLPTALMGQIQNDMRQLVGTLSPPSNPVLVQFNNAVRDVLPDASLSQKDALELNDDFATSLLSSGANGAVVADLQSAMNKLAQVDANSTNPTRLATDDYSTILQVSIAVGQPIPTPARPRLAAADRFDKSLYQTTNTEPRFTGTYQPKTTINLVNLANGAILGSVTLGNNAAYTVRPSSPLAPGVYTLGVQSSESGVLSPFSDAITITVRPTAKLS